MAISRRALLAGLGLAAAPRNAWSADFYRNKSLILIVGFAPGGGVDTTARLVGRHIVRFIPGQPSLVVQNMEGAGGIVAANYLNQRVAADGLTIAVPGRSWFMEGIVKSPGAAFDPTALSWIGSPGAVNSVLFVRAATGIRSFEDLQSSPRVVTFGSIGSTTPTGMIPTMLAATGLPIKVIFGYGSTARVLIALEQGEVDGMFTVEDSFARRQDLIKNGTVIPILQNKPTHPGLPLLRDVLAKDKGRLLDLVMSLENLGLPVVGPAGIPADRLEVLRDAFLTMCRDADYQAEAIRLDQPVGAPLGGQQLAAMIKDLAAAATPGVVAAYKRLGAAK
jgi:tripartite-type tricarboxylate transporter receptor subunit TctC